jgi:hypothetical protein
MIIEVVVHLANEVARLLGLEDTIMQGTLSHYP